MECDNLVGKLCGAKFCSDLQSGLARNGACFTWPRITTFQSCLSISKYQKNLDSFFRSLTDVKKTESPYKSHQGPPNTEVVLHAAWHAGTA